MEHRTERSGRFRARSMIGASALVALVGSACGGGGGTQTNQTQPSGPASTSVAPSSPLTTFTSPIYGYSIDYPSSWAVRKAERQLTAEEYPDVDSEGIDYFSETPPGDPKHKTLSLAMGVAGPAVARGTTLGEWAAKVEQSHRDLLGCAPADAREDLQIGGEPGRLLTWQNCPAYLLWAAVVHGGQAFDVWMVDSKATGVPSVQATDKALFTQLLASLAFTS